MAKTYSGTIVNVTRYSHTGSKITVRFDDHNDLATFFNGAFHYGKAKTALGHKITLQHQEPTTGSNEVWKGLTQGQKTIHAISEGPNPNYKPKSLGRDRGWYGETRNM